MSRPVAVWELLRPEIDPSIHFAAESKGRQTARTILQSPHNYQQIKNKVFFSLNELHLFIETILLHFFCQCLNAQLRAKWTKSLNSISFLSIFIKYFGSLKPEMDHLLKNLRCFFSKQIIQIVRNAVLFLVNFMYKWRVSCIKDTEGPLPVKITFIGIAVKQSQKPPFVGFGDLWADIAFMQGSFSICHETC